MPSFGASDALVRRRSRRALWAAAALALPFVVVLAGATAIGWMIALVEAVGFLLLPAMAPNGVLTGERRGAVRADRMGLYFQNKLVLSRERIQTPWVEVLEGGERCVHFSTTRARDELAVVVADEARAEELLEALELRRDRHVASFVVESAPLRSRTMQRLGHALVFLGSVLLTALLVVHAYTTPAIGFALVPVLFVYSRLVRRARRTTRVVVGTDGVLVRTSGVLRQIPHAAIRGIGPDPASVDGTTMDVGLAAGDSLTLRFAGAGAKDRARAFAARMKECLAAREPPPGPLAEHLEPSGRTASVWLDELRRMTSHGGGYRDGAVPEEELWRIVEHPAMDAGARAGAVIALVPRLDGAGRARIGTIAGATACPDLKAALDGAAAGASEESIASAFQRERLGVER